MTVTHRSISVAKESSFGSLSSSTGLPDNSGLTYISIPCERDPIIIPGEVVASERNDAQRWFLLCATRAGHSVERRQSREAAHWSSSGQG